MRKLSYLEICPDIAAGHVTLEIQMPFNTAGYPAAVKLQTDDESGSEAKRLSNLPNGYK